MNKSIVDQSRATWTHDLSRSEPRFLAAINEVNFGRFECLRIQRGELVLDPWATTVRYVKLGSESEVPHKELNDEYELECPVIAFARVCARSRPGRDSPSRGAAFTAVFDGNRLPAKDESNRVGGSHMSYPRLQWFRNLVVPDDLADRDQWLLWRYEGRNERATKVPYSVRGCRADNTNPRDWTSFDVALTA
jgi:hypothetical protein